MGYVQGMIGSPTGVDYVIHNLAIIDALVHTSTISKTEGFKDITIYVFNGLNQAVDIVVQASPEAGFMPFVVVPPLPAITVPATSDDYTVLTEHHPYIRVTAQCPVAPTSGTLTVVIVRASRGTAQ